MDFTAPKRCSTAPYRFVSNCNTARKGENTWGKQLSGSETIYDYMITQL